jgi:hypothetical protein
VKQSRTTKASFLFFLPCAMPTQGNALTTRNATAFNTKANSLGQKIKAVYSSDIGHWDVPDMTEVTEEAGEPVEHGVISEDDFRDFVFTNPTTLWTGMNLNFFKGTIVEQSVKNLMAAGAQ